MLRLWSPAGATGGISRQSMAEAIPVALVRVSQDGRHERCDRERQPEREHEKSRQKIGHVVGFQSGPQKQKDPDRSDQRTSTHASQPEQEQAEAAAGVRELLAMLRSATRLEEADLP